MTTPWERTTRWLRNKRHRRPSTTTSTSFDNPNLDAFEPPPLFLRRTTPENHRTRCAPRNTPPYVARGFGFGGAGLTSRAAVTRQPVRVVRRAGTPSTTRPRRRSAGLRRRTTARRRARAARTRCPSSSTRWTRPCPPGARPSTPRRSAASRASRTTRSGRRCRAAGRAGPAAPDARAL